MKVLFVAFPSYPLLPPDAVIEKDNKPHKKRQKKEILLSSVPFFLSSSFSFELLSLDSFSFSEVFKINPELVILDASYYNYLGEDYLNNYRRIVYELKEKLPLTKIVTISNQGLRDAENLFLYSKSEGKKEFTNRFIGFLKEIGISDLEKASCCLQVAGEGRGEQEVCLVQELVYFEKHSKYYREIGINYFYLLDFDASFDFYCLRDISYKLQLDFEDLELIDLRKLELSGCIAIVCNLELTTQSSTDFSKKIKSIKEIQEKMLFNLQITPKIGDNKTIVDFLNLLEKEKISYRILKSTQSKTTQNMLLSLIDNAKDNITDFECLKNRMSQDIYTIPKKLALENIIEAIFELDKQYLDIYLDLIHLLDGCFTTNEIIACLIKLHPNHSKEEITMQTTTCISSLEKKHLIFKLPEKDNQKKRKSILHLKSVFPQREDMLLMYSGSEMGYFMFCMKNMNALGIEKISKAVFFFFLFSKGIYYIREVADKLHLLFGDSQEFNKENYFKTTQRIYQLLKRYKLCK